MSSLDSKATESGMNQLITPPPPPPSSNTNQVSPAPITYKEILEQRNLELKNRQMEVEILNTQQKTITERADSLRKSLSNQYPMGKDCTHNLCHPYTAAIKEVLWGFTTQEVIDESTTRKYSYASENALHNLRVDLQNYSNRVPSVPNLISGLPLPFTFSATNQILSRDDRPYWFYPYTQDPNPGKNKHGQVTWECRDLSGGVVATQSVRFNEHHKVALSCNDIASKFAEAKQTQNDSMKL